MIADLVTEEQISEEQTKPEMIVVYLPAENYDQNNLVEVLEAVEGLALPLLQKLRRTQEDSESVSVALHHINQAIIALLD